MGAYLFNSACWVIFMLYVVCRFFQSSFLKTIRVSNSLDPDQGQHFVGPDLGLICLQRLSADDNCRQRLGFRKGELHWKDCYFVAWTGPCGLTFWKCSWKDNFEKILQLCKICNFLKNKKNNSGTVLSECQTVRSQFRTDILSVLN